MRSGKRVARQLAAKGRGGDSVLVHMHPEEVKALAGLGALAGQPMTKNPHTGMPEAFNLRQALALAAPIAASMVGGPLAGAAVSGLTTYAATGDPQQAMLSGVAAGALGSTLSGIGGGAADAGAQAATQGVTDAAVAGGTDAAAQQAVGQGAQAVAAPTTTSMPGFTDAATGVQYDIDFVNPTLDAPVAPVVDVAPAPAFGDMTLGQKMSALKDADWFGKGGPILNEQGGIKAAPFMAGASYMGLQGLNEQMMNEQAMERSSRRSSDDMKRRFDYYKRMAGSMPANQIPMYRG